MTITSPALKNIFNFSSNIGFDQLLGARNLFILYELGPIIDKRTPPPTTGKHRDSRFSISIQQKICYWSSLVSLEQESKNRLPGGP